MSFTTRPTLRGFGGAVSAGHYQAAFAGHSVLAAGGNAADAAAATGFALQVVEPQNNGPAGEVPILYYAAAEDRVFAISGQGTAPAAATLRDMRARVGELIPGDGLTAATVPAALDAWCRLLERFGTRSLEEVLSPARDLAGGGFAIDPYLYGVIGFFEEKYREEWRSTGGVYLPRRRIGERQTNPALAAFFDGLIREERHARGSRERRIRAARDSFYKGRPAEIIERFARVPVRDSTGRENSGFVAAEDLARYEGRVEEPVAVAYRGNRVWKCGPWTQGPVFLQQLRLLEGFDLAAMGHNSVDALHTWLECAKLAFADREACYADPDFADLALEELLSEPYADKRRELVEPASASRDIRPGMGSLPEGWPRLADSDRFPVEAEAHALSVRGQSDTTHLDCADRFGNVVAATPSGAWIQSSPVIPELGFPLGTRAQMFALDPQHPNVLAPGKRPRTTLTPSLARLEDGRLLAFGTQGGDQQDQWTLQLFLNVVDFGVRDLQEAIDLPTVHSRHTPSSFYPRVAMPGVAFAESRLPRDTVRGLEARGHDMRDSGPWAHGRVLAVARDPETGLVEAAASPRAGIAYATVLP